MKKSYMNNMQGSINQSMAKGVHVGFKHPTGTIIKPPGETYTQEEKAYNTRLLKGLPPVEPPVEVPVGFRMVETRKPYLEAYYEKEIEKLRTTTYDAMPNSPSETQPSPHWKRSTPNKKVEIDLAHGEIVQVAIFDENGKDMGVDYFYKNMVRTDIQHDWAANVSLRGIGQGSRIPMGNVPRDLKFVRVDLNRIEKAIREMRFLERFCSGESRNSMAFIEKLSAQRILSVMEDGVRRLMRHYKDQIVFIEAYGEQHLDLADYPDSCAFNWPTGAKQIMENKDVLLVFARRHYDEYLLPTKQQLEKEMKHVVA